MSETDGPPARKRERRDLGFANGMSMQTSHIHPPAHEIHIVVEVDGKNKPVTLDRSDVTGREIRTAAGAPLTDDLTRVIHGKPSGGNIELDEKVKVKNGDRFLAIPTGTVS